MNLLDRNLGLIVVLALFLFSCEDTNEIGTSLNPDDKVGVYYVDLPVEASMVYLDSINTGGGSLLLSGVQSDATFGTTEVIGYTQLAYSSTSVNTAGVFDSVTFSLKPSYFYGEDSTSAKTYGLYRVSDDSTLKKFTNYYSSDYFELESQPLAEGEFTYHTVDLDSNDVKRDDLFTFKVDQNFGEELFNTIKSKSANYKDSTAFYAYLKGLAVVGQQGNNAVVGFDLASTDSKMTLYYHTADTTLQINLKTYSGVQTSSRIVNVVPTFNYIHADRSGIVPSVEPYKEFTVDGKIYGQSGTGLVPKLKFGAFKDFADSVGNIIINSGEFLIGGVETSTPNLTPPPSVKFYLTDETNERKVVVEGGTPYFRVIQQSGASPFISNSPLTINYLANNKDYFGLMTLYLQAVADGTIDFDEALVYPTDWSTTISQLIVNSSDIKLRIYFTKLKAQED